MVRTVDYQTRNRAVLSAAINRHIKEGIPIASEGIAQDFSLSSATIRNIFAGLEKDGYLTHPYTSGGRIPTKKGYRYYVDFLLSQMELLEEEKEAIIKEYKREINRIEDALERTSEVISAVTHYASVVSLLNWQDRFFYKGISFILEEPEFQDSARIRLLIKMLEDKQHLLNALNRDFDGQIKVYIGEEIGCDEISNCALAVSIYNVKNQPLGRLAVLGPMRMDYSRIIPALGYVSAVLTQTLEEILE